MKGAWAGLQDLISKLQAGLPANTSKLQAGLQGSSSKLQAGLPGNSSDQQGFKEVSPQGGIARFKHKWKFKWIN